MYELLWNILIMFCFSSIFLGFQTYIYLKNNSALIISKRIFICIVVLFSIVHAILIQFIPQFIMPLINSILFISICILVFKMKFKEYIKLTLKLMLVLLIIDVICMVIYDKIFFIDVVNMQINFNNIIISLPVRIIETFIIIFLKKR